MRSILLSVNTSGKEIRAKSDNVLFFPFMHDLIKESRKIQTFVCLSTFNCKHLTLFVHGFHLQCYDHIVRITAWWKIELRWFSRNLEFSRWSRQQSRNKPKSVLSGVQGSQYDLLLIHNYHSQKKVSGGINPLKTLKRRKKIAIFLFLRRPFYSQIASQSIDTSNVMWFEKRNDHTNIRQHTKFASAGSVHIYFLRCKSTTDT